MSNDDSSPADRGSGLSDQLGAAIRRVPLYTLAYFSAVPMLAGWLAGLLWHRMADGWRVARRNLDAIDDAVIDDMESRRGPSA